MFVFGYLFSSLALMFSMIFKILYILLVARIVLSWFQVSAYSEFVSTIYRITDVILLPFRKIPLQIGMIDFTPILAFMAISIVGDHFMVGILRKLAYQFGVAG